MTSRVYVIEIGGVQTLYAETAEQAAAQARVTANSTAPGVLVRAVHIATGRVLYEAQRGRALRLDGVPNV